MPKPIIKKAEEKTSKVRYIRDSVTTNRREAFSNPKRRLGSTAGKGTRGSIADVGGGGFSPGP